ncbi:MAG TPA: hypothetical protein PKA82_00540 [Pyrinomonadaceae bacterium]|nr:hypothetical protein [Pyrinomonadaceae bacterium]
MERATLMIATLFVVLLATLANAQPAGYTEVPSFRSLPSKKLACNQLNEGVIDEKKLAELRKTPSCAEHIPEFTNAGDQTLVYYSVGSDCHMKVAVRVFRVDLEKKYKVIINNIYGGCRAGGHRSGWVSFEKPPTDYQVEMNEVRVDRPHYGDDDSQFVFPKPPTTKSQASVSIREVDLGECFQMTGQSQWILATREHLDKALRDEKPVCRENVDRLGLDLSREALVGYSFSSGYCHRPVGLEFTAIHETSSDPKEDRLMIKAGFRDVGDAYCKVWTTYPVWLVVEKPEGHFRYEFFAESKK